MRLHIPFETTVPSGGYGSAIYISLILCDLALKSYYLPSVSIFTHNFLMIMLSSWRRTHSYIYSRVCNILMLSAYFLLQSF